MHTWGRLFERAAAHRASEAAVCEALDGVRGGTAPDARAGDSQGDAASATDASAAPGPAARDGRGRADVPGPEDQRDPAGPGGEQDRSDSGREPGADSGVALACVVADADVLAADLLVGGDARDALDVLRAHSWYRLAASDPLLGDAARVVERLADDALAADWRERARAATERVEHPAGDQPALASAYRAGAAHVLSMDEALTSARAGAELRARFDVSVLQPGAFARTADPEAVFEATRDGDYAGPDADPRE